jgi:hypothetical protein
VCDELLAANAVPAVVQSLRTHMLVAAVVAGGVEILHCLTRTEPGRVEVTGKGGTAQLLVALEVHANVADIQVPGVEAAVTLALNCLPTESKLVAKRGRVAAVLARMADNMAVPDVQLCGTGALWVLTRVDAGPAAAASRVTVTVVAAATAAAAATPVLTEAIDTAAQQIVPRVILVLIQHSRHAEVGSAAAAAAPGPPQRGAFERVATQSLSLSSVRRACRLYAMAARCLRTWPLSRTRGR